MKIDLSKMQTENRNSHTLNLDSMSSLEIATAMNKEDNNVIKAINSVLPKIAKAIDCAYTCIKNNGRVIYIGAGTSGRLGVLDASECPPTFGVNNNMFIGLIAGGEKALTTAVEGAEDSKDLAVEDLKNKKLNKRDLVIGVAASGRTPYVIGALEYAKKLGCKTISISCNLNSKISEIANIAIEAIPGPEVLTGSTRLKAGTTQKLILNMISTGAMVKMGKTYSNLMVDVVPTNDKLRVRAQNIVKNATNCKQDIAEDTLKKCNYKPKIAIIMILKKCDAKKAEKLLKYADGHVKKALKMEDK